MTSRATTSSRVELPLMLATLLLGLAAIHCGNTAPGTALRIQVDYPTSIAPTQLHFDVSESGDALSSSVLPATPGAPLASGQTMRVPLPDSAAGSSVSVSVDGLAGDKVIAHGTGNVKVVQGQEVKLSVTLVATSNCDAQSCPAGCCSNGECVTAGTPAQCGTAGNACAACDSSRADNCVNGACQCGSGAACADGEVCSGGQCVCQGSGCACGTNGCNTPGPCETGPGTCDASSGKCTYAPKANGTSCDDGNACTQTDTCQSGVCTGTNPKACGASDPCHSVGVCDPSTGVCSNPAKADGSSCDDGDACTQTDTCQSGVCTGTNPKSCAASDQCHVAGVCDPGTGVCSNPAKTDGSSCNDGNACTQSDTCQSGVCTGANPKTCTALDQCHNAGTCNPSTGVCSTPQKANGTSCNDGNACTQTDTCQSGVCTGTNPKTCTAIDQCHRAGTCNTSTGVCSNPQKANGTSCNDGNVCTKNDTCQSGTCTGAANDGVKCSACAICSGGYCGFQCVAVQQQCCISTNTCQSASVPCP